MSQHIFLFIEHKQKTNTVAQCMVESMHQAQFLQLSHTQARIHNKPPDFLGHKLSKALKTSVLFFQISRLLGYTELLQASSLYKGS